MSESIFPPTVTETALRSAPTVAAPPAPQVGALGPASGGDIVFRGLRARRVQSHGGPADRFVLEGGGGEATALKLYPYGVEPDPELRGRLADISRSHPGRLAAIHEAGFDGEHARYFEIQEHFPLGSLEGLFAAGRAVGVVNPEEAASELCEAIAAIQGGKELSLGGVRPENVMIRSISPFRAALSGYESFSAMRGASLRATRRDFSWEYLPPENAVTSLAGDWWALGILLFRLLTGATPFPGWAPGRIRDELALRPVKIPEIIPERRKLLLRGLLTRSPRHRWGAPQVREWLAGGSPEERYGAELPPSGKRPFLLKGASHDSLEGLAAAMAASPEAWAAGAAYIGRGTLLSMLRGRGELKEADRLEALADAAAAEGDDPVFRFVHDALRAAEPSWRGIPLTGAGLYAALASDSPEAEDLSARALDGRLAASAGFLLERGFRLEGLFLAAALGGAGGGGLPPEEARRRLFEALGCALRPDLFFWGGLDLGASRRELEYPAEGGKARRRTEAEVPGAFLRAAENPGEILAWPELEAMGGDSLLLPPGEAALLGSPDTYREGAWEIRQRFKAGRLLRLPAAGAGRGGARAQGVTQGQALPGGSDRGWPRIFPGTDLKYEDRVNESLRRGPGYQALADEADEALSSIVPPPDRRGEADVAALEDLVDHVLWGSGPCAPCDAETLRRLAAALRPPARSMYRTHLAKRYPGCPWSGWAAAAASIILPFLVRRGLIFSDYVLVPAALAALCAIDAVFWIPYALLRRKLGRLAGIAREGEAERGFAPPAHPPDENR